MKKIFLFILFFIFSSCEANKTYVLTEPGNVEIDKIYTVNTNKKGVNFKKKIIIFFFGLLTVIPYKG